MKESGKDWTDCLTTRLEGGVGRGRQSQRQGETERTCFYLKWAPVFFNKSRNEDAIAQGIALQNVFGSSCLQSINLVPVCQ